MEYRVPFGKVVITPEARKSVIECLDNNWISQGPKVREFEEAYAKKFNWDYCLAVSSGSMAGIISWLAIKGKLPFGRVVTSASAFGSTLNCLTLAGLRIALVDIDFDTLNINTIIASNPEYDRYALQFIANMGNPSGLRTLRKSYNHIVGDFCEGHGASYEDGLADRYCDIAFYSFFPAHILICGEGGMICTNDPDLYHKARSIRENGKDLSSQDMFRFDYLGLNGKMTDIQASIGLDYLSRFDDILERRTKVRNKLCEIVLQHKEFTTIESQSNLIAPHALPIVINDRYNFIEAKTAISWLATNGIQAKSLFGDLSQHKYSQYHNIDAGFYNPIAQYIGTYGFHIGCHEGITEEDLVFIDQKLRDLLRRFF